MPDISISQILLWLFGQLVVGAAIWGGIRADIRSMHTHIADLREQISKVTTRLDRHIEMSGLHLKVPD